MSERDVRKLTDTIKRDFVARRSGRFRDMGFREARRTFNTWLDAIRAEAWDDGYATGWNEGHGGEFDPQNPYRKETDDDQPA